MVKICPYCHTKNFDDAKYCMSCTEKITEVNAEIVTSRTRTITNNDQFGGRQPQGYTPEPWQGRLYTKLSLSCIVLFFVFFFIYPAFIVLFLFSVLASILGKVGASHGDKSLGKFTMAIGVMLLVFSIILYIITFMIPR
jgi:hypothetical protein